MHRRSVIAALALATAATATAASAAPTVDWALVARRPHDRTAFTEGLVAHGAVLLESTGLQGQSSVRRLDPRTGRVLARTPDAPSIFGEGLTVLRGTAWQLTWQNRKAFTYSPSALRPTSTRPYPYEGWGLTTDGTSLIASDGSPTVRWLNPATFAVTRSVTVTDDGTPLRNINELEMINGVLWANVWLTTRIALINPTDGHVRGWIDMASVDPHLPDPDAVLNGVAVDPVTRQPIVTGKRWPWMYVIRPGAIPA